MIKKSSFIFLILVLSASLLLGFSSEPIEDKIGSAVNGNEVDIEATAMKLVKDQKDGGYKLIATKKLKKWIEKDKDMILIDTMPQSFYQKQHIPGAVNSEMPKTTLSDATKEQKEAFAKLLGSNKDKTIVIYCGFTKCGKSHVGAKYARQLGYKNVYRHPGGIIAWKDAGYKVE